MTASASPVPSPHQPCRRQLLTRIVPACAMSCALGGLALGSDQDEEKAKPAKGEHKFDLPAPQKFTQAQLFQTRYGEAVQLAQALWKEWGEESTVDFLQRATTEKLLRYGAYMGRMKGDNSFESFVSTFRSPNYDDTMTKEVVVDTETEFELKVTECLWAKTFRDMGAARIGHAHVCIGDYAWAQGFNPKITMTRDKTLMQGDSFCNHHYTWTE